MVWDDIVKYKLKFRSYRLHSKIALSMTAALTLIGTALFFIFEHNNTAAGLGFGEELLLALFNSVTPRTAGFNTVDTAALSPASTILTICYMFIGHRRRRKDRHRGSAFPCGDCQHEER